MSRDRLVLVAVLALLAVPPLASLGEIVRFRVRDASNGRVLSSGERRSYLLYVPAGHDEARPVPLVLSLHGGAGWPAQQRDISGWNAVAERHGFLVAYPSAREGGGPRAWGTVPAAVGRDVRFIADLLDALEDEYAVDPRRIYANGLSNGGAMASVLSCALSERIAAVGTVAAAVGTATGGDGCEGSRPVPLLAFHGTADPIVPYAGGSSWVAPRLSFPDVRGWVADRARRNGCGPDSVDTRVAADVTRRDYGGCRGGASVVLYTVHGGGHTWPGGEPLPEWFAGPTTRSLGASREMWRFFAAHPLPDPG